MADELEITGRFDPTPITEGINKAAADIKNAATMMEASFKEVQAAESQLEVSSASVGALQQKLADIEASLAATTSQLATAQASMQNAYAERAAATTNVVTAEEALDNVTLKGQAGIAAFIDATVNLIAARIEEAQAANAVTAAESAEAALQGTIVSAKQAHASVTQELSAAQLQGLEAIEGLSAAQTQDIAQKILLTQQTGAATSAITGMSGALTEEQVAEAVAAEAARTLNVEVAQNAEVFQSVQAAAQSIAPTLTQAGTSASAAAGSIGQLGEVSAAAEPREIELAGALDLLTEGVVAISTAIKGAGIEAIEEFATVLEEVVHPLSAGGTLGQVFAASINAILLPVLSLAEGLKNLISPLTQVEEGMAGSAAAGAELAASITGPGSALAAVGSSAASAATQLELFAEGSGTLITSLSGVETSVVSSNAAIASLQAQLAAASASFAEAAAASDALAAAGSSAPYEERVAAATAEAQAVLNLAEAQTTLNAALVESSATAAASASSLIESAGAFGAAGAAAATAGQQLSLFAEAAETVQIAAAPGPLVNAAGQYEMFSQAVAGATGQLSLFETELFGTGMAAAAAAEGQTGATVATRGFTIALGEGVVANTALAKAMQFLNSETAVAGATSAEVKAAWNVITTQAQKLGLELVKTAAGFELLAVSGTAATEKLSQMSAMMAMLSGRMAALDVGVPQLGFALGIVGRSSAAVAAVFNAAFPVIGLVLAIELISSLKDKLDTMIESIRKTRTEFDDLASTSLRAAESIELSNLKLEDQISKLEGRPTANRLAEALLEDKMQAQELSKSLEDATEKALQLLKSGEVGILKRLFTGQESTTGIRDALKTPLEDLEAALADQNEARLSGDKAAEAHATEHVAKMRTIALAAAEDQKRASDAAITERKKVLEKGEPLPGAMGLPMFAPSKSAEEAAAIAEREARSRTTQINATISMLKSQELQEKAVAVAISEREKDAAAANAADARARQRTLTEPGIKADLDAGKERATAAKQAAENSFRETEANVKLQIALAVTSGKERVAAEVATNDQILAARKKLTTDLIAAQKLSYDAEKANLEDRRRLISATEVGPKRVADLEAITRAEQLLEETNSTEIKNITSTGETALVNLTAEAENQRTELYNRETQRRIEAALRESKLQVETARSQGNEEVQAVQVSAEEKLREVSSMESLRTITYQQARDRRLAILEQEMADADAALDHEKKTLEAQRDYIQSVMATVPPTSAAFKELQNAYASLTNSINKVTEAQTKLNQKIGGSEMAAQTHYLTELQKRYEQVAQSIGDKFTNMFQSLITGQATWAQAAARLLVQFEAQALQMIVRIVARHIAGELAKSSATAAGQAAQTAATTAGSATRSGVSLMEDIKSIGRAAATAAAHAFKWVMEEVPFPVNVVLAPAVAAGVFVSVLAFQALAGTAEKGALLGSDMPVFAHAQEMILPRDISTGLQNLIETGHPAGAPDANATSREDEGRRTTTGAGVNVSANAIGGPGGNANVVGGPGSNENVVGGAGSNDSVVSGAGTPPATSPGAFAADSQFSILLASMERRQAAGEHLGIRDIFNLMSTAVASSALAARNRAIEAAGGKVPGSSIPIGVLPIHTGPEPVYGLPAPAIGGPTRGPEAAMSMQMDALGKSAMETATGATAFTAPSYVSNSATHSAMTSTLNQITGGKVPNIGAMASTHALPTRASMLSSAVDNSKEESAFNLHYHAGAVSALDRSGFQDVLNRHPDQMARFVRGLVKQGRINPKSFLK